MQLRWHLVQAAQKWAEGAFHSWVAGIPSLPGREVAWEPPISPVCALDTGPRL